jgi:predicted dehydrogenase
MTRRVAIVGAGIGAEHLSGYLALPERFAVAAICDLDLARARPLGERAGCPVVGDHRAVLADPAIDLVDICLPPHLHFPVAIEALAAGKHVVCEKPLVSSLREADALIAAAARADRRVFPVFQYRYGPGFARLAALQAAGLTGQAQVATLETHWNRPAAYYAVPWRGKWATERGGAVLGHAIHIHDLLTMVLGPVASLQAELATRVNDIEVEDCAAIAIRMRSGALVTSSITLGAANDTSRLRFVFAGLTAQSGSNPYAPAQDAWTFTARAPVDQAQIDAVLADVPEARGGFAGFLEAVADALDGRGGRDVTLADGRASLDFVTAVYHAARTGTKVALPLAPDHALYADWVPPRAVAGS